MQPELKKQLVREPNGTLYKGEFLNGHKAGLGVALYSDGRIFKGAWRGDCPSGPGLYMTNFGLVVSGTFDAGFSIVSSDAKFFVPTKCYSLIVRKRRGVQRQSARLRTRRSWRTHVPQRRQI